MSASVELLKAARAKIADPANWTTGAVARSADGVPVPARSPVAKYWSALGALNSVLPNMFGGGSEYALLSRAASKNFDTIMLVEVNDYYGHEAVLKIYDHAIADAEAEARSDG